MYNSKARRVDMNYKEIIMSKGIKQTFLATKLGMSKQYFYQCIHNFRKFPSDKEHELRRLLGLK